MLISLSLKNQKNISKIFAVFSLMLICPFSSLAADFCCAIPEGRPLEKPIKHLKFTNKNVKFYPSGISKQLSKKYQEAITAYNTFVDKSSASDDNYNFPQFPSVDQTPSKFSSSEKKLKETKETFSASSNWLSTFYEKFLSPKTAEASDTRGIHSYPELKSILNKKHSFQDNALVEF